MSSIPSISSPSIAEATGAQPKLREMLEYVRRRPLDLALGILLLAATVYFFGFHRVFMDGKESVAVWANTAWNSENDLEHGFLVLPAALFIAWYHRKELWEAPKASSSLGLVLAIVGAALYVLAIRALQPRLALLSLPFLCYGGILYLWGRTTARILLFPCLFLLAMIPIGFLVSRTVGLQTLAATVAANLSSFCGIGVLADGTQLRAVDGSFQFEVAGGCSGIRSLTAMTLLSALYVHFTRQVLWKKAVIVAGSLLFALIGNLVRIFTVVLVARFVNPEIATGIYHDYSGFIFFPIAVFCMLGVANLLNRDYSYWLKPDAELAAATAVDVVAAKPILAAKAVAPSGKEAKREGGVVSYDY